MNDRVKTLASQIRGIPNPPPPNPLTGSSGAFLKSMTDAAETVLMKGIADKLVAVLSSTADAESRLQLLSQEKKRVDTLVESRGAKNRHVKVLLAMHAIIVANIEGRPEPTDEELGLTNKCFIATACYDSPDCVEVQRLREFRDRVLLRTRSGRLCVAVYYHVSPPLAAWLPVQTSGQTGLTYRLAEGEGR